MVCLVCLRVLHHHQPSAQSHLILQGSKITFSEVNYSEVVFFSFCFFLHAVDANISPGFVAYVMSLRTVFFTS